MLMILKMKEDPHPLEFYKGLELFNRGYYYECHDVWEEIWGDAKGKNKIFYQALIMSAVSLYHFGNENLIGALSCYQKALHQFNQLPDHFLGLDIRAYVASLSEFYGGISSEEMELNEELLQRPRPKIVLDK
jgi:predicted metal-dependent hydrolase